MKKKIDLTEYLKADMLLRNIPELSANITGRKGFSLEAEPTPPFFSKKKGGKA